MAREDHPLPKLEHPSNDGEVKIVVLFEGNVWEITAGEAMASTPQEAEDCPPGDLDWAESYVADLLHNFTESEIPWRLRVNGEPSDDPRAR